MTVGAHLYELTPARRRRLMARAVLRALATTAVLVALYYLLPLDHITNVPVTLTATVPLFLLLFAWAYFTMANNNPGNFNTHPLTRTDALYFTVTVFSTVGFGDIVPVSQSARLVVTVQMLLDLLALGLVVRAFVGAVQFARQQATPAGPPGQTR